MTATHQQPTTASTPHEYARHWLKLNEIKIKTVTVEAGQYNPHFVYINRIGNGSRPKFRILRPGKDTVKNCMMITFNPDRYELAQVEEMIKAKLNTFAHLAHGSCHRFINQQIIGEVLSEAVKFNGWKNDDTLSKPVTIL